MQKFSATTIVAVRHRDQVALGGDGQVTLGDTVVKGTAQKVRKLRDGKVLAGFAGSVADAFTLFEKFEEKLERYRGNLPRAAVERATNWRTESLLHGIAEPREVADREHLSLISGDGNVIEPGDEVIAIGSGGGFAIAAARALRVHSERSAPEIVRHSLEIAGEICVYTNTNITVLELE